MKLGWVGLVVLGVASGALGQARSTAGRTLDLSGFVGGSGVFTGLNGGRNLALTGGADVSFRSFYGLRPSLEVRGTYPVDSGQGVALKSFMGGLRVERPVGNLRVYGDALYGSGNIDYHAGLLNPQHTFLYNLTSTGVLSLGGGVDYVLGDHFSVRADGQYQSWNTPVTESGKIHPVVVTLGVVYRLNLGLRRR